MATGLPCQRCGSLCKDARRFHAALSFQTGLDRFRRLGRPDSKLAFRDLGTSRKTGRKRLRRSPVQQRGVAPPSRRPLDERFRTEIHVLGYKSDVQVRDAADFGVRTARGVPEINMRSPATPRTPQPGRTEPVRARRAANIMLSTTNKAHFRGRRMK